MTELVNSMTMTDLVGDPSAFVVSLIFGVVTGGLATAIVQGFFASKRGVKSDALASEKNALDGYASLTARQVEYMANLERRLAAAERSIEELKDDHRDVVTWANILEATLLENTIPIPPRPRRVTKPKEKP